MTLAFRSIIDRGNLAKERITFRATEKLDVGDYALLQCSLIDGTLTTSVKRAYWFQYEEVERDDLVVIYTKSGENSVKTLSSGSNTHFFYWGLRAPIWVDDDLAAVLLRAPQWEFSAVSELT